jgi:hypothetical protein
VAGDAISGGENKSSDNQGSGGRRIFFFVNKKEAKKTLLPVARGTAGAPAAKQKFFAEFASRWRSGEAAQTESGSLHGSKKRLLT